MKTKHYLASANSGLGFKNFFDNILSDKKGLTYILKGGPGTGKSTLIKNAGKHFESLGIETEYFYCSSDPDSLDGIKIGKNVLIADGTAPHIMDATMPGIKEKIVNVSNFLKDDVAKHRKKIERLLIKKSQSFKIAYAYLKTLGDLIECERLLSNFKSKPVNLKSKLPQINLEKQNKKPCERKLFASYISSDGIKYTYFQNHFKKVFEIKDDFFVCADLLKILAQTLYELNYKFISFFSVLNPNIREAILIEDDNVLIINSDILNKKAFKFKNKKLVESLIKKSGKNIEKAKIFHKKIEDFYIKSMDFEGLEKLTKTLFEEIEKK